MPETLVRRMVTSEINWKMISRCDTAELKQLPKEEQERNKLAEQRKQATASTTQAK